MGSNRCRWKGRKKDEKIEPMMVNLNATADGPKSTSSIPDSSTSALVESVLSIMLPLVRKSLSNQLINDGSVIHHEEPVTTFDEENMPIGRIEINIEDVLVQNRSAVLKDIETFPNFQWPEKKRTEELMVNTPGEGRQMIVLDLVGFDCKIPFEEGFELTFPAELPMGIKSALEVGCGGKVKKAWIRLLVPKLRFWFVTPTRKAYVAFMGRPQLTPHLHVNADRGKGDFFDITFTEDGSLDDVVEAVLSGFGPEKFNATKPSTSKTFSSWVGNAVGKKIGQLAQSMMGDYKGKNGPIEIDLSETIQFAIDSAMGIPRSVEAVKADIALLEKELERSIEAEKKALDTKVDHEERSTRSRIISEGSLSLKNDEGMKADRNIDNEVKEKGTRSSGNDANKSGCVFDVIINSCS